MRKAKEIVGYYLHTGERRVWQSITEASREISTNVSYLSNCIRHCQSLKGWCCSYIETEFKAIELYQNGGNKRRYGDRKPKLVTLRLNHNTVIWVKPEEATPEFAKFYLEQLNNKL